MPSVPSHINESHVNVSLPRRRGSHVREKFWHTNSGTLRNKFQTAFRRNRFWRAGETGLSRVFLPSDLHFSTIFVEIRL